MVFGSRYLALALSLTPLARCLPLNGAPSPRNLVQRTRSYAVVNVDGGSTALAEVTTTALLHPTSTTSTPASTTKASSTSIPTPAEERPPPSPVTKTSNIVTVIVTETAQPTEFYDDGMWHTRYPVKYFGDAVPALTSSSTSRKGAGVPGPVVTPPLVHFNNQTVSTTTIGGTTYVGKE
ncbi:uncharacterized protein EI97DRAFT_435502 [Westerdykella ornata]|uniref:Uncharacterized protein n=1 Tax=Westerdykella ornata TaxID=318751 RepID=A0A6A6JG15_WESOR|nr:uncharacterized protein EI97DRAFT_435502 [Westerdykella ornata]KAF2274139.1 hypothetical protein EI97DRAFT_435502 [Westerdykella ornata]